MKKQKKIVLHFLSLFIFLTGVLTLNPQATSSTKNKLLKDIDIPTRFIVEFSEPALSVEKRSKRKLARSKLRSHLREKKANYITIRSKFESDFTQIGKRIRKRNGKSAKPAFSGEIKHDFYYLLNAISLELGPEDLREIRKLPYVKKVYPDREVTAVLDESPQLIKADVYRQLTGATGEGIVVAVIDTGIDYLHPDLGGGIGPGFKVIGGYDFINNDNDPMDDNGHGTHCAGIIAAHGSVNGVAPNANLIAYKVLNVAGSGIFSDIIAALEQAANPDGDPYTDDKVDVVSISIGGYGDPDDALSLAVDNAVAAGIVCVVAAGNESNYYSITSPGCARGAITVGATDKNNKLAYFSSKGPTNKIFLPKPDIVAPGVNINSTVPDSGYGLKSGTSMATPHISGCAALILQIHPEFSPADVKNILRQTAVDLGYNALSQGSGLVNLEPIVSVSAILNPTSVYLGEFDDSQPLWQSQINIDLENISNSTKTFSVSWQSAIPAGFQINFPQTISLNTGESAQIPVGISVDSSVLVSLSDPPYIHEGYLVFTDTATSQTYKTQIVLRKEASDPFEPNNNFSQTYRINVATQRKIIKKTGKTKIDPSSGLASNPDLDYFKFYAEQGNHITIDIDAGDIGSPLDSSLTLYTFDQTSIKTSSDVGYHPDPLIRDFLITSNGDYSIKIDSPTYTTGTYHLITQKMPDNLMWFTETDTVQFISLLEGGNKTLISHYNSIELVDNLNNGLQLWQTGDSMNIIKTDVSQIGSTIAVLNKDGTIYQLILYDTSSSNALWQYTFSSDYVPSDLAVSDDGNTVAVYAEDKLRKNIIISIFNKETSFPQYIHTQNSQELYNKGFQISSNGSFVSFSDQQRGYIFDINLQSVTWSGTISEKNYVLSGDGSYIIGASSSSILTFRQWNGKSYEKLWDFSPGNGQPILDYAISDDSSTIVIGQRVITGYYGLDDSGLQFYVFNKNSNIPLYKYYQQKNPDNVPQDDFFGIKLPNTTSKIIVSPDGKEIAIGTWGADPEQPEVMIFSPEYQYPIGEYYAHGSVGDISFNNHKLTFFSEGKHYFHFFKDVMSQHIVSLDTNDFAQPVPPFIKNAIVDPQAVSPGNTIKISAFIHDNDGILNAYGEIYNKNGTLVNTIEVFDNGLSPDTTAGDHIYTGNWITASQPNDYYFIVRAIDTKTNTAISEKVNFTTNPSASISVETMNIVNDTEINPGEKKFVTFTLINNGSIASSELSLKMAIQSPFITEYTIDPVKVEAIEPGEQVITANNISFISASYNTPPNYELSINVEISDSHGNKWLSNISIIINDASAPFISDYSVSPRYTSPGKTISFKTKIDDGSKITQAYIVINEKENDALIPVQTLNIYDDGKHNDEYNNDGIYGLNFSSAQKEANYTISIHATDSAGNSITHENLVQYSTKPFIAQHNILLVDDTEGEPDLINTYISDLQAIGMEFDNWRTDKDDELNSQIIDQYKNGAVIWFVGNPSRTYQVSSEEQDIIEKYLDSGGNILLCGQHISYFLTVLGQQNNTLLNDYFGAEFIFKDTNCLKVEGISTNPLSNGKSFVLENQFFTGEMDPFSGANTLLIYDTLNGGGITYSTESAAIQKDTQKYRSMIFDFDFSGLKPVAQRRQFLSDLLNHFSSPKITDINAEPKMLLPQNQTTITAQVSDPDGISSVQATVKNSYDVTVATITLYDDGTNGDITSSDNIYTGKWTTLTVSDDFFITITATDNLANQAQSSDEIYISTYPHPDLKVNAVTPYMTNHFAPGKLIYFDIQVKNVGTQSIGTSKVKLSISDQYVEYYNSWERDIASININNTVSTQYGSFYLKLSSIAKDNHPIELVFNFVDTLNRSYQTKYKVYIKDTEAPVLSYFSISPRNPVPGENVHISAKLIDGKEISQVKVTIYTENHQKVWEINLYDDGIHNDSDQDDLIFANYFQTDSIPCNYYADISLSDSLGNSTSISPADIFTTITFEKHNNILLIDDSGGLDDNLSWVKDYFHSKNIPFDEWKTRIRDSITDEVLSDYICATVLWFTGTSDLKTISQKEIQSIKTFLNQGGNLLFSGEKNPYNIASNSASQFLKDYFHLMYLNKNISIKKLIGVADDAITNNLSLPLLSTQSPGEINIYPPASPILYYDQSSGSGNIIGSGIAGLKVDTGTYKLVFFDFSWDAINSSEKRYILMDKTLSWLGFSGTPYIGTVKVSPDIVKPADSVLIEAEVLNPQLINQVYADIESPDGNTQARVILFDDATHGDLKASDGIYSRSFLTSAEEKAYFVDIPVKLNNQSYVYYNNKYSFSTISRPELKYTGYIVQNNTGIQPATVAYIGLGIKNNGPESAGNVECNIEFRDENISFYNSSTVKLGTIPAMKEIYDSKYSFYISTVQSCPVDYKFKGHIKIKDLSGIESIQTIELKSSDNKGPFISELNVTPKQSAPSQPVSISAKILDGSGIAQAKAEFYDSKDNLINEILLERIDSSDYFSGTWITDGTARDYYFKVKAKDTISNESISSTSVRFTTIPFVKQNPYLLVFPPDTSQTPNAYIDTLKEIGIGFDIWEKDLRGNITSALISQYYSGIIIYSAGRITSSNSIPQEEQQLLVQYLTNNGRLLISGSNIVSILTSYGTVQNELISTYLGTKYLSSIMYIEDVIGVARNTFMGESFTLTGDLAGEIEQVFPAQGILMVNPPAGSTEVLKKGYISTKILNGYRAMLFNFRFKDIEFSNKRKTILEKGLLWLKGTNYLGPKISSFSITPLLNSPTGTFDIQGNIEDSTGISSAKIEILNSQGIKVDTLQIYDDGAHNDGAAADKKFGNSWASPSTEDIFTGNLHIENTSNIHYCYPNLLKFSTKATPWLYFHHHELFNSTDFINGTTNYFSIYLINNGTSTANDVKVKISSDSPYVAYIPTTLFPYGSIQTGESGIKKETGSRFSIRTQPSCPNNTQIKIKIEIFENSHQTFTDYFTLTFYDKSNPTATGISIEPASPSPSSQVMITVYSEDVSGIQTITAQIKNLLTSSVNDVQLYDDGNHFDNSSSDGIYGGIYNSPSTAGDFEISIISTDTLGNTGTSSEKKYFTTKDATAKNRILIIDQHTQDPTLKTPLEETFLKAGIGFDIWKETLRGKISDQVMNNYINGIIIWDSKTAPYNYFTDTVSENISNYILQGGYFILIGEKNVAYITDYGRKSISLMNELLSTRFVQQPVSQVEMRSISGNPVFDNFKINLKYNKAGEIESLNNAFSLFRLYPSETWLSGGISAVACEGVNYKSAVYDFSFDDVSFADQRYKLINNTLIWFNKNTGPRLKELKITPKSLTAGQPVTISSNLDDSIPLSSGKIEILDQNGVKIDSINLKDDGVLPDLSANDNIFTGTYIPTTPDTVYYLNLIAQNIQGIKSQFDKCGYFYTSAKPFFKFESYSLKDTSILSPGTFTYFGITIKNTGTAIADNVQVTLDASDQFVGYNSTIPVSFGTVNVGESKTCDNNKFRLKPAYSCPNGYQIEVSVKVTDTSGGISNDTFFIPVTDTTAPYPEEIIIDKNYAKPGEKLYLKARISEGSGINEITLYILGKNGDYNQSLTLYDDGTHGDSLAGDFLFANMFTVPFTPRDYYLQIYTKDNLGNSKTWTTDKKFTSIPFASANRVLLLDDDGASTNVEDNYKQLLNSCGYSYDYWDINLRGDPTEKLLDKYIGGCVLLFTGVNTSTTRISSSDQTLYINYLNKGGNIVLTGRNNSYLLTNYGGSPNELLNNYFHAQYQNYSYSLLNMTGTNGDWITSGLSCNLLYGSADECDPISPATSILNYTGSSLPFIISSGSAAIKFDSGVYKTILYCFKIEDLTSQTAKQTLVDRSLQWILGPKISDAAISAHRINPGETVVISCKVTDSYVISQVIVEIESPDETVVNTIQLHDNGVLPDITAGDNIFTGNYTTPSQESDFYADIKATNVNNLTGNQNNILFFTSLSKPYLNVQQILTQSGTNQFTAGTTNYFDLYIKNEGNIESKSTSIKIILDDSIINSYSQAEVIYGNILPGSIVHKSASSFFMQPSIFAFDGQSVEMKVLMNGYDNGSIYSFTDTIPVTISDNTAPVVYDSDVQERNSSPGTPVFFKVAVYEGSGIESITADIKSNDGSLLIQSVQLFDDGLHSDNQADDYVFSNSWITLAEPQNYIVDVHTRDNKLNANVYQGLLDFNTINFEPASEILLIKADYDNDSPIGIYQQILDNHSISYDIWDMKFRRHFPLSVLSAYKYSAVVLVCGDNGVFNLDSSDYLNLKEYLRSGGRALFTGENLSLAMENDPQANHFLNECMYAYSVTANTDSTNMDSCSGNQLGINLNMFLSSGAVAGEIDTVTPAKPLLKYNVLSGGGETFSTSTGAFTVFTSTYGAVFFDFGLEKIANSTERESIFIKSLEWMRDLDNDGLTDNWEIRYFGSINPHPDSDPDNDSLTNIQEQSFNSNPLLYDTDNDKQSDYFEKIAGTDPNDPLSTFVLTNIILEENGITITWKSVAQKNYRIYYCDLESAPVLISNFQAVSDISTFTDTGSSDNSRPSPITKKSGIYYIKVSP